MPRRILPQLEYLESRDCPAPIVVDTTADVENANDGVTSLREAIGRVNAQPPPGQQPIDEIRFNIAGGGEKRITLAAVNGALPPITKKVLIDGTAPVGNATQVIVLDGSLLPVARDGLVLAATESVVKKMTVTGFRDSGIKIIAAPPPMIAYGQANVTIVACDITANGVGVTVLNSGYNLIGRISEGNTISANQVHGVDIRGQKSVYNSISANDIGSNRGAGINVASGTSHTFVGSYKVGEVHQVAGNVVTSNLSNGINIAGNDNLVVANKIGIAGAGFVEGRVFGNTGNGISVRGEKNSIGTLAVGTENFISGNQQHGIQIVGAENSVTNNRIGLNLTGLTDFDGKGTRTGNRLNGVQVFNGGKDTYIIKNVIGGNVTGINVDAAPALPVVNLQIKENIIGEGANREQMALNKKHGVIVNNPKDITFTGNKILVHANPEGRKKESPDYIYGENIVGAVGVNVIAGNEVKTYTPPPPEPPENQPNEIDDSVSVIINSTGILLTGNLFDSGLSVHGATDFVVTGNQYTPTPTVTGLSSDVGYTNGGKAVLIAGSDYTGAEAVYFGTSAAQFWVGDDGSIIALTPAHAPGTVAVTVVMPSRTVTVSDSEGFTYLYASEDPSIFKMFTVSGSVDGGTSVVISGMNFTSSTEVTFDGVSATSVTVISPYELLVVTPAHTAGVVDVVVTTLSGSSEVSEESQFTYLLAPVVQSLDINTGPVTGWTQVTITGENLSAATAVFFGSVPAEDFFVNADGTITATAPPGVLGAVDVTVVTPGGMSGTTLADLFTYVEANTYIVLNSSDPDALSGESVTFSAFVVGEDGTIPQGTVTFYIDGLDVISVTVDESGWAIFMYTGLAVGSHSVVAVYNGDGIHDISTSETLTQTITQVAPTVTGMTPNQGSAAGGTWVTITGSGFSDVTGIFFGGTSAGYVIGSDSILYALAPAHAVGTVEVTVTNTGGTSVAGEFDYTPIPATVTTSVWLDTNGDGVRDAGEPGFAYVIVVLLSLDGGTTYTATTDADGNVTFADVAPGQYLLEYELSADCDFTLRDQGSDETDSDANVSTGQTDPFTVFAGDTLSSFAAGMVLLYTPS